MASGNIVKLVGQNLRRNKKNFVFSGFGIVVGISTFIFFVALGEGIKTVVLEEIFVVRQIEVVPRSFDVGVIRTEGSLFGGTALDDATADELRKVPGVKAVYPKMKLMFPARAWGGKELMGKNFWTEFVADGVPPEVISGDFEGYKEFRDWNAGPIACSSSDTTCPDGRVCNGSTCVKTTCEPPKENRRGNPVGNDPCPGESYCATDTKTCEVPIPVIANPRFLEIYNGSIHTAMKGSQGALAKMPRLTPDALVGFTFHGSLGKSYLGTSAQGDPVTRKFKLVGFSNSAIGLGVTMPIGYVMRFNRRFRGDEAVRSYHSLLIDANSNEEVAEVARVVTNDMGLALDDKYENAQKAGLMITIVTAVFSLISVLIILISAVNIMHTFLMLIVERRRELGIMRAIGATKLSIATLIVLEAMVVGVIGGALGSALGVAATWAVDAYFNAYVGDFPFKPDTLFAWQPWFFVVGVGGAALFCLLGAVVPATRAANTDPAAVLTGH